MNLRYLSDDDTRRAIAIPARSQAVEFTADALSLLVAETAGYPFYIQEYASAMWTFTEGPTIDADAVQKLIPGIRKDLDEQFYALRFPRLTGRECAYVLALAGLGSGPQPMHAIAATFGLKSSELSSIRGQLVRKEIIFAPSPGMVEFRMPLTDRYVARNLPQLEARARGFVLGRKDRSML